MRVPYLIAFAGLSVSLAFAQQPSTAPAPAGASSAPVASQQQPAAAPATAPAAQQPSATVPAASPTVTADNGKKPKEKADKKSKNAADSPDVAKTDSIPNPGEELDPHIKKGSEDDVNAVGQRSIGGRGLGNWYSTNWEISNGKQYSMEIEKSSHLVTDPVVVEYVNRIGQNLVKNSDAKVPFTIKVLDTDEINAMALPGGFFYVNSGLILAADDEAELAGVMAHEIAHVAARHATRGATRSQLANIMTIPLIFVGGGIGYAAREAAGIGLPLTFLSFSRGFEAEADYLGVQYMYKAGYDPNELVNFFEKIQAQEKKKPGSLAKAFATHPQTPDRIQKTQEEIATILPSKDQYIETTSEFNDVKSRLAAIENRRKVDDSNPNKPTLRRTASSTKDNNGNDKKDDDRPTLKRRDN